MGYDKIVDSVRLDGIFTGIADAVRRKNGLALQYAETELEQAIDDLPTGPSVETATGTVYISAGSGTIALSFVPDILTFSNDEYSQSVYLKEVCFDFSLSDTVVGLHNYNDKSYGLWVTRSSEMIGITARNSASGAAATMSMNYKAYKFTE